MRLPGFLLLVAVVAMATPVRAQAPAAAPQPAPSGPFYSVTYFEVAPPTAGRTVALLRQFAAATKKEPGNVELTPLHEIGRPGRFAIVEAWRDKAAFEAHTPAMKALGEKLQASFASPFDARPFWGLSVAGSHPGDNDPATAIYVLTHVDVFPGGKDEVAAMIKQLAADSRKESGSLRFDALVWDQHLNHFHLVEEWAGRGPREAHALAAHTRQFRAQLVPFEGALYDERLYEVVR